MGWNGCGVTRSGSSRDKVLKGAAECSPEGLRYNPRAPVAQPFRAASWKHLASTLLDAAIATLIAPVCACCHQPLAHTLDGGVCGACWTSISVTSHSICNLCGDALPTWRADPSALCVRCRRRPRVISRGRAIGVYEGTLRDILHSLKYEGRRSVARGIGERMAAAGGEVLEGADALVPVPLHWFRQYQRGFNQAEELARHIGLPLEHALRRRRRTVTQTDLPESQRLRNVAGAFRVHRRAKVQGRVLVIVDDVSTTGATLDACAAALLERGAKEVRALTAARAVSRLV